MKASNGRNMPGHDTTNGLGGAMSEATQKVALVTGSARGIGLATAKRFLADGWRVVLLDIDGEILKRTFTALNKPDVTLALVCDVADPAGVARALATIAEIFGLLNALVNNAGIAIFKPILDITYDDWSRVLAVNLTGPFLCSQAAAPLMRDSGGGAIVNITSISGLDAAHRLRHKQSRPCAPDPTTGVRTRVARYPGQCRRTGSGRYRDGKGRPYARNPRRLSRRHSPQPLWPGARASRGDLLLVQRARQLHHRADDCRRWRIRGHRHWPANAAQGRAQQLAALAFRGFKLRARHAVISNRSLRLSSR